MEGRRSWNLQAPVGCVKAIALGLAVAFTLGSSEAFVTRACVRGDALQV